MDLHALCPAQSANHPSVIKELASKRTQNHSFNQSVTQSYHHIIKCS